MIPHDKHLVLLSGIVRVQKGAGKNSDCINLVCTERDVTLRIDDEELRHLIISGFVALVDRLSKKASKQKAPEAKP